MQDVDQPRFDQLASGTTRFCTEIGGGEDIRQDRISWQVSRYLQAALIYFR